MWWPFPRGIPKPLDVSAHMPDATMLDRPSLEPFDGPLRRIPQTRTEVYRVFGDPGVGKPDPKWERKWMVVARNLPGDHKVYCHRLVEPYLREALRRCGTEAMAIDKIGCWNFRHQRHDPARPLSYHAWGIAADIDPADNSARQYAPGLAPEPFSEGWHSVWPYGVSERIVLAFESVGWRWGGRWKGFVDPMHFEMVA